MLGQFYLRREHRHLTVIVKLNRTAFDELPKYNGFLGGRLAASLYYFNDPSECSARPCLPSAEPTLAANGGAAIACDFNRAPLHKYPQKTHNPHEAVFACSISRSEPLGLFNFEYVAASILTFEGRRV